MSTLQTKNLTKTYGFGHTKVVALEDVTFSVKAGEVLLIMGPSGSGKTTLLSLLGTLLKPTSGSIVVNDREINRLSQQQLPKWRLKEIGFIFQHFNLLSALTAQQNVMVPLLANGWPIAKAAERARELLETLHLANRAGNVPANLSGGEQQRVAIARALANNPNIILADEPTANLDAKTGKEIVELLASLAKQERKALVIVSHDPRIQEVADRLLVLNDGKLV